MLLALYAAMAFSAALGKGASFDETLQLAVGYNLWRHDDYRLEGANGDLVKRWATLPYLLTRPNFVDTSDPAWRTGSGYDLGRVFFFERGNIPEALLRQARAMNLLLGVAAGALVFACARELFGAAGGLVALALFVFSPAMLAFGGVVSTDMSITLTLLASTWCLWRLLHRVTLARLAASLLAVALLVLAKLTALAIFPIAAVLVATKLAAGAPLSVHWRAHEWLVRARRWQAVAFAVLALAHVAAAWGGLWAHYGFRYHASPNPADPGIAFYQLPTTDEVPPVLRRTLDWLEATRLVPEGFRHGVEALLLCDDALGAFMDGHWRLNGGWAWFFPYAIWVKTTPALFALLACASVIWWLARARGYRAPALYAATPHLALIACYLAIAMTEDINIGHRHVLPIYPSLNVLAGGAVLLWRRAVWTRLAVVLPLVWLAADSLRVRPDYLAYFGAQAGGPENGYKHLVDSSLDWGMDLPALKTWLDAHDPQHTKPLFLSYFGNDQPAHYGIGATLLPGFMSRRTFEVYGLKPGYYAISASMLQGVYSAAFGPWSETYEKLYQEERPAASLFEALINNPARHGELVRRAPLHVWASHYDRFDELRFARLAAWLRHKRQPQHQIGHSIFVWELDAADLREATLGPPVELDPRPSRLRCYRTFSSPGNEHTMAAR